MTERSWYKFLVAGFLASLFLSLQTSIAVAEIRCKCKTPNATTFTCFTNPNGTCEDIVTSAQNPALVGYTCDEATTTQFLPISSNGLCTVGPLHAKTFQPVAPGGSTTNFEEIKFKLNVPIPGLTFTPITTISKGGETELNIPFFAQYVSAIYRYLLGIVVLAAGIMIVLGGFHYILGTTLSSVTKGKTIIRDAIIGLVLAFSAYTILTVLNPATTTLDALNISYITQESHRETIPTSQYWDAMKNEGSTVPDGLASNEATIVDQSSTPSPVPTPPPETAQLPPPGTKFQSGSCNLVLNQAGIPTVESLYQCGVKVATDVGIPPCYVIVAINHESFFALPNLTGHDENVTAKVGKKVDGVPGLIDARIKFLANGTTFKGNPVGPNTMNDDIIDPTKEDLGFDKRYSHGGGIMGMTVPCIAGKCYSQRDRLDPYKGIEGPTLGIRDIIKSTKLNPTDPAAVAQVWKVYRGVDPAGRTRETIECFKRKDPLEMILPIQFNVCRGDLPLEPAACKAEIARLRAKGYPALDSSCAPVLGCADKRMPIKRQNGVLMVR